MIMRLRLFPQGLLAANRASARTLQTLSRASPCAIFVVMLRAQEPTVLTAARSVCIKNSLSSKLLPRHELSAMQGFNVQTHVD